MTYSDSPVAAPENDTLGTASFAEQLAQSIIDLPEQNAGFVYGLYGAWGCGKTSIINFIEHYIDADNKAKDKDEHIVVFRFNPWMFAGSEQLTRCFFKELQLCLQADDVPVELQQTASLFNRLGLAVMPIAVAIADGAVPGSGTAAAVSSSYWHKLRNCRTQKPKDKNLPPEDLHHLREDIKKVLKSQKSRILIIIDDLDRMAADEIQDIVRMIKAVCDFPNVIYLLACDQTRVAEALSEKTGGQFGVNYLEKIVQFSVPVPIVNQTKLEAMFKDGLKALTKDTPHKEYIFNEDNLVYFYSTYLRILLKTPRNIIALLNALNATYPMVEGDVDVYDFIAVQCIRVFYPDAYYVIADKNTLAPCYFSANQEATNNCIRLMTQITCKEGTNDRINFNDETINISSIPKDAIHPDKKVLFDLLDHVLFSHTDAYLGIRNFQGHSPLNLTHRHSFDTYFSFTPTRVPLIDILTFLRSSDGPEQRKIFEKYGNDLFRDAYHYIEQEKEEIRWPESIMSIATQNMTSPDSVPLTHAIQTMALILKTIDAGTSNVIITQAIARDKDTSGKTYALIFVLGLLQFDVGEVLTEQTKTCIHNVFTEAYLKTGAILECRVVYSVLWAMYGIGYDKKIDAFFTTPKQQAWLVAAMGRRPRTIAHTDIVFDEDLALHYLSHETLDDYQQSVDAWLAELSHDLSNDQQKKLRIFKETDLKAKTAPA